MDQKYGLLNWITIFLLSLFGDEVGAGCYYSYYYSYYYCYYYYYYYGTTAGTIAGAVVGGIIGLAVIIGIVVFVCIAIKGKTHGMRGTVIRPTQPNVTVVSSNQYPTMPQPPPPYGAQYPPPAYSAPPPAQNPAHPPPQPFGSVAPPPSYSYSGAYPPTS